MSKWSIEGSRVYGGGMSFNCTNIVTAKDLQGTLNTYEQTLKLHKNIETQYDNITKTLIQINMTLSILNEEIKTLTSGINELNNKDR